jgi:hypothetical protein
LHSAFTAPIGRSSTNSSTATVPVTLTPSTNYYTPRVLSARSSLSNIDTPDDENQQEHLDERLIPFSLTLHGAWRLCIIDILQLKVGDQFNLVIPTEHHESKLARSYRSGLRDLVLKRSIRNSLPRNMSTADQDDYVKYDMSLRQIERERWNYQEYTVLHTL